MMNENNNQITFFNNKIIGDNNLSYNFNFINNINILIYLLNKIKIYTK